MVKETIFQHWIATKFIYPFLLIWTIVFALLGKTKLLGENKQVDSIVAFVIAFIFVGALQPKEIVSNLILFLTVALVVMFVALLLWGFVSGGELKADILGGKMKWVVGIAVIVAVMVALLWATGSDSGAFNLLFRQDWSSAFWTNISFIVVVAIAMALVLKTKSS